MKVEEIPKDVRKKQCVNCMSFSEKWGCAYNHLHINKEGKCFYWTEKEK